MNTNLSRTVMILIIIVSFSVVFAEVQVSDFSEAAFSSLNVLEATPPELSYDYENITYYPKDLIVGEIDNMHVEVILPNSFTSINGETKPVTRKLELSEIYKKPFSIATGSVRKVKEDNYYYFEISITDTESKYIQSYNGAQTKLYYEKSTESGKIVQEGKVEEGFKVSFGSFSPKSAFKIPSKLFDEPYSVESNNDTTTITKSFPNTDGNTRQIIAVFDNSNLQINEMSYLRNGDLLNWQFKDPVLFNGILVPRYAKMTKFQNGEIDIEYIYSNITCHEITADIRNSCLNFEFPEGTKLENTNNLNKLPRVKR